MNFLKQIFTWWHKQTVGTCIYTVFTGKFAGKDQFGNKYYSNSKGRRWVIYKNDIEASKIPPEWHSWIHFLIRNAPSDNTKKYSCQFILSSFLKKATLAENLIFLHCGSNECSTFA